MSTPSSPTNGKLYRSLRILNFLTITQQFFSNNLNRNIIITSNSLGKGASSSRRRMILGLNNKVPTIRKKQNRLYRSIPSPIEGIAQVLVKGSRIHLKRTTSNRMILKRTTTHSRMTLMTRYKNNKKWAKRYTVHLIWCYYNKYAYKQDHWTSFHVSVY